MSANFENVLIAALVGTAGWFVKDLWFGLIRKRSELERAEWEYRLKDVFCPLYFWSGLLAMRTDKEVHDQICEHLHDVMAKAAYLIPQTHYYTLVRLLEAAHGQVTTRATANERDKMRAYLHDQIEAFNLILYRSEDLGGVGDPSRLLSPTRWWFRLLLVALSNLLVWLLVALLIGGLLWLYQNHYPALLGSGAALLLVLVLVDLRRRAEVQRGIEERLTFKP